MSWSLHLNRGRCVFGDIDMAALGLPSQLHPPLLYLPGFFTDRSINVVLLCQAGPHGLLDSDV